jgi:hypothetical protein
MRGRIAEHRGMTKIYTKDVQSLLLSALMLIVLLLTGCGFGETKDQRHQEANSVAGKVGQAAHKAVVEAQKATNNAGRQLTKAAHDAREGWKEESRKSKGKE